jgi:Helix-turn-helix domain
LADGEAALVSLSRNSGPKEAGLDAIVVADEPKVLIPFNLEEAIPLKEAAARAGRSESTIKNWCRDHHIGRRVGGVWMVSRVALSMFLDGDRKALIAYLSGERSSDRVKPYFDRFRVQAVGR